MSPTRPSQHRPALIIFITVAAVACIAMAYWQWSRFESASGSAQNLGYALQWPAFAVFFFYAYRRYVRLESGAEEASPKPPGTMTEIPTDLLPERPKAAAHLTAADADDAETRQIVEYNRYLAELTADEDAQKQENK